MATRLSTVEKRSCSVACARAASLGVALLSAVLVPACISSSSSPTVAPNVVPMAAFVFSPVSPILAGQTQVTFNASESVDSDGRIAAYTWDFGDTSAQQTSTVPTITHVFPVTTSTCVDITYTVLLTVTDNAGGQASFSNTISVTQRCPQ